MGVRHYTRRSADVRARDARARLALMGPPLRPLFPHWFKRGVRPAATPRRWRGPFLIGVLIGAIVILGGHWLIDNTSTADHLVAPLLTDDTTGRGDVIVVLGAAVNERCSPNLYAIRRVMAARDALAAGRAPRVLITGGRAAGTPCAVSEAMAALLVQLGVSRDRISVETGSFSTWDNARLSDPVLRALGARRIVLITDALHMRRAEACFRSFGYQVERLSVPVSEGHPDNVSMLGLGMRETVAWTYYRLKGRFDSSTTVTAASRDAHTPPAAASVTPESARMAAPPTFPQGPIVIIGASYAKGWTPSIPGRRVINKGVNGQQSWEVEARFASDALAEQPRAVVIWGFINDIFRSQRPQTDATIARIHSSFRAMVAAARAQGVEPILATEVTITHPNTWKDSATATIGWLLGRASYQDYINGHVSTINEWLRDYARQEGLLLLDLQAALADANGRRQRAFAADDGSHISALGYDAISRAALPAMSAHLARP
jgi:uncharacterized SAM-binding protein YcdF (DUF218 family)/lysophospholipase L1-like esterase